MTAYMRTPKKAKSPTEGWWYANKGSIDVFVSGTNGHAVHCRIKRSDLLRYIEKTEPKR